MELSNRIQKIMSNPSAILEGHLICHSDPYSIDNPNGYLNFGIAENHLMDDMLLPYLNKENHLEKEDLQYFDLSGHPQLRKSCKLFFEKYFNFKIENPDNFVITNGLSTACECLSYSLFNDGDYLMIPTPYYTGFEFDFQKRFNVNFLNVHLESKNNFYHDIKLFKESYESFSDKSKIKAILLTHPHNPTGEVLSKEFLTDIIAFAKEKKLEIITDEIYALTRMDNGKHNSLMKIGKDYDEHIHFMYGLAKDFTLAGFKVGIFYSKNEKLVNAMKTLSYFHCVSSLTQKSSAKLLSDFEFIDLYLEENNKRLRETKNLIISSLPELKYIDGDSGLFFLVDFRKFLKEQSFEEERKLWRTLIHDYKISLSCGQDMGINEAGFFRLCFSKSKDSVNELIKRLKVILSKQSL